MVISPNSEASESAIVVKILKIKGRYVPVGIQVPWNDFFNP